MSAQQRALEPPLRFPAFSGAWEEKQLGDAFSWIATNSLSRAKLTDKGHIQNIHYGDIHSKFSAQFRQSMEDAPYIMHDELPSGLSGESFCRVGDVIIADASEDYEDIGKSIEIIEVVPQTLLAGLHTYIARPRENCLRVGFSGYLFQTWSLRRQIMTVAQGISVLGISKTNISKLKIYFPSAGEQQKIADYLGAVDAKLRLLERRRDALSNYKKGMMQRIFSQEIRFTQDDGTAFPDWQEKRLGDISNIRTGKLDANAMRENGQYRFYTCAKEYYRIDSFAFDTEALIVSGNGANVGYIHYFKGKFNAYQRTYVIDGISENILFVEQFLRENLIRRIEVEKKAGNTPYIVMGTLTDMIISLPDASDEQQKIADFLSAIDDKITAVTRQISSMQDFKKSMLQQMFV